MLKQICISRYSLYNKSGENFIKLKNFAENFFKKGFCLLKTKNSVATKTWLAESPNPPKAREIPL